MHVSTVTHTHHMCTCMVLTWVQDFTCSIHTTYCTPLHVIFCSGRCLSARARSPGSSHTKHTHMPLVCFVARAHKRALLHSPVQPHCPVPTCKPPRSSCTSRKSSLHAQCVHTGGSYATILFSQPATPFGGFLYNHTALPHPAAPHAVVTLRAHNELLAHNECTQVATVSAMNWSVVPARPHLQLPTQRTLARQHLAAHGAPVDGGRIGGRARQLALQLRHLLHACACTHKNISTRFHVTCTHLSLWV